MSASTGRTSARKHKQKDIEKRTINLVPGHQVHLNYEAYPWNSWASGTLRINKKRDSIRPHKGFLSKLGILAHVLKIEWFMYLINLPDEHKIKPQQIHSRN
jgi:hypothetical protein